MRFEKYVRVLDMLNHIEQEDRVLRETLATRPYQEREVPREQAALRFTDELLEYLHANWPVPASATDPETGRKTVTDADIELGKMCDEMLRMKQQEFEEKLETLPPYFCEYIFPVCAIRYVLRELQAPFRHRQSKHFGEFHRRYGYIILHYY